MRRSLLAIPLAFLFLLILVSRSFGQANTPASAGFQVLYNFTDHGDGCCLLGGVARDRAGNLYGMAYLNFNETGPGDLYRLTPGSTGYKFQVLENLNDGDGLCLSTPALDSKGNLYGVCNANGLGDGVLWQFSHGRFSILHTFKGATDGMAPEDGVSFADNGNIYGTTYSYGAGGGGTLWEYSPSSGAFNVLHAFADGNDGAILPTAPRIDSAGKLWGTTEFGPNCFYCGSGTVWNYDLTTAVFTTVLDFPSGIVSPGSRLAFDAAGNAYGTALSNIQGNCGLVYQLQKSNSYAPVIVYEFTGKNGDGCLPYGGVSLDAKGNILGTTYGGGSNGASAGTVYETKPVNGGWQETILHSFSVSDGDRPQSGLVTDGAGNWFGTTAAGGKYTWGTVFEISGVQ